jgi:uncharacterized protein
LHHSEIMTSLPTLSSCWHTPTELSVEEYADLLSEIQTSLNDNDDSAMVETSHQEGSSLDNTTVTTTNQQELERLVSIWGPELLDAARYNEIDVVRAILQVAVSVLEKATQKSMNENNHSSDNHNKGTFSSVAAPLDSILHYSDALSGNTAWHMAAANGHLEILQLLRTVVDQQEQQVAEAVSGGVVAKTTAATAATACPSMIPNHSGNTPLHWAAANGHAPIVEFLLNCDQEGNANVSSIDVLLKNNAGRSILTEGFSSSNEKVIDLLLSHDSASEERLVNGSSSSGSGALSGTKDHEALDVETTGTAATLSPTLASVTHDLVFGPRGDKAEPNSTTIPLRIRELAMATHQDDCILGQAHDGSQDTTGYSVWAASLILAQWLAHEPDLVLQQVPLLPLELPEQPQQPCLVVELGCGCGVPGLVAARILATRGVASRVYLTDFNPVSVDNGRFNIALNETSAPWNDTLTTNSTVSVQAAVMNWQDKSTWPEPLQQVQKESHSQQHHGGGGVDLLLGSDLMYQDDMVPLLLQTVLALRPRRFLYVAHSRRAGHAAFLAALHDSGWFDNDNGSTTTGNGGGGPHHHVPPPHYRTNPLASQDDEECFVHFHELVSNNSDMDDDGHGFVLYDFVRRPPL